jgi:hypothetical protein
MTNVLYAGEQHEIRSFSAHDSSLLEIDANEFATNFNRLPFLIGHQLSDHPLFQLDRLLEMGRALPEELIEYNAGTLPVNQDQKLTPRNGLSVDETIRRIEECKSWMVLKHVEHDPAYRDLLHECLAEVRPHSERIAPGMREAYAYIFLTSPGSVTPYHMDPEHNFLLQVRGSKVVHLFDGRDRTIVSDRELEVFYGDKTRNMELTDENRAKAMVFDLQSGQGLHFPVTYPHWVQNGNAVSVSFSITFRTPDLDRRNVIYSMNNRQRKRGGNPTPYGASPWKDRLKYNSFRAWRKAGSLFGKNI